MNYSDDYLINLLKVDSQSFFEVCIFISDLTGELPAFGKYVSISHNFPKGIQIPESLLNEFEELKLKYGHIDIHTFNSYKDIDIPYFENSLKESFQGLINTMEQQKDKEDFEGIIAYSKSIINNIDFRRKKESGYINGVKYEFERQKELFKWFDEFKKRVYCLSDQLVIELNPNDFFHILIGHVDGFIVPRKGKAIQFSSISSPSELVEFIDEIVDFLKPELIIHYDSSDENFDRKNFNYKSAVYGIHIKRKRIITLYPVDESQLTK